MTATPTPKRGSWLVALTTALALVLPATPLLAAPSPEAAVNELFARVAANDLGDLDDLVCAERVQSVEESFGELAAFGRLTFSDLQVSLVSQEGDTALVRAQGTMRIEIDEAALRELVRQMIAAGGEEPTEEQVDSMVDFMRSSMSGEQPIDEEIRVILEGGEWLVCDELGGDEEPDPGYEPSVSQEGMCGLASPEELSALGPLVYDSSDGFAEICTYSYSSFEAYHSVTLSLDRGIALSDMTQWYPEGQDTSVAGLPAYAVNDTLFVQAQEGVLQVQAYLGEDDAAAGLDPLSVAIQVAELFIPRLSQLPGDPLDGPDPDDGSFPPTDDVDVSGSLCDLLTLAELNALASPQYADATGDSGTCTYSSAASDTSFSMVSTSLLLGTSLDELKSYFPEGEDLSVAGHDAYSAVEQLWVDVDDDTLVVTALTFAASGDQELDLAVYRQQIAEIVVGRLMAAGG